MNNVDPIWIMILLPIILFGPPLAQDMWTKRKEKAKELDKNINNNKVNTF